MSIQETQDNGTSWIHAGQNGDIIIPADMRRGDLISFGTHSQQKDAVILFLERDPESKTPLGAWISPLDYARPGVAFSDYDTTPEDDVTLEGQDLALLAETSIHKQPRFVDRIRHEPQTDEALTADDAEHSALVQGTFTPQTDEYGFDMLMDGSAQSGFSKHAALNERPYSLRNFDSFYILPNDENGLSEVAYIQRLKPVFVPFTAENFAGAVPRFGFMQYKQMDHLLHAYLSKRGATQTGAHQDFRAIQGSQVSQSVSGLAEAPKLLAFDGTRSEIDLAYEQLYTQRKAERREIHNRLKEQKDPSLFPPRTYTRKKADEEKARQPKRQKPAVATVQPTIVQSTPTAPAFTSSKPALSKTEQRRRRKASPLRRQTTGRGIPLGDLQETFKDQGTEGVLSRLVENSRVDESTLQAEHAYQRQIARKQIINRIKKRLHSFKEAVSQAVKNSPPAKLYRRGINKLGPDIRPSNEPVLWDSERVKLPDSLKRGQWVSLKVLSIGNHANRGDAYRPCIFWDAETDPNDPDKNLIVAIPCTRKQHYRFNIKMAMANPFTGNPKDRASKALPQCMVRVPATSEYVKTLEPRMDPVKPGILRALSRLRTKALTRDFFPAHYGVKRRPSGWVSREGDNLRERFVTAAEGRVWPIRAALASASRIFKERDFFEGHEPVEPGFLKPSEIKIGTIVNRRMRYKNPQGAFNYYDEQAIVTGFYTNADNGKVEQLECLSLKSHEDMKRLGKLKNFSWNFDTELGTVLPGNVDLVPNFSSHFDSENPIAGEVPPRMLEEIQSARAEALLKDRKRRGFGWHYFNENFVRTGWTFDDMDPRDLQDDLISAPEIEHEDGRLFIRKKSPAAILKNRRKNQSRAQHQHETAEEPSVVNV